MQPAIVKAVTIVEEVSAAEGDKGHPNRHISIMHEDGHQVSRVIQAAPAVVNTNVEGDLTTGSRIEILLVEDLPGDIRLIKEAFYCLEKPPKMHHAWDGAEALEFLKQKPFGDAQHPDLILLDLDIPAIDGREVLAQIKGDPHLRAIPIIVLAASHDPADVLLCYKLHANCYLEKPANWDEFDYLATSIDRFWLTKATTRRRRSIDRPA